MLHYLGEFALLALPSPVDHTLGHHGAERDRGPLEGAVRRVIALLRRASESAGGISSIAMLERRLIPVHQVVAKVKRRAKVHGPLRAGVIPVPSKAGFVPISCQVHDSECQIWLRVLNLGGENYKTGFQYM
jgi:hypothetical protein